jgi:hypothetical protein
MTSSKHTPGPWMTFREPNDTISINYQLSDGTCGPHIATVVTESCDDELGADSPIAQADARLIAAAPELLEACRLAANLLHDSITLSDSTRRELRKKLLAAVALATSGPQGGKTP